MELTDFAQNPSASQDELETYTSVYDQTPAEVIKFPSASAVLRQIPAHLYQIAIMRLTLITSSVDVWVFFSSFIFTSFMTFLESF